MYNYLDFEKPVADLEGQILELKKLAESGEAVDVADEIARLEKRSKDALVEIYRSLTPWQKAQVARHPDRPHCLDYVRGLFTDFTPLAGDRAFGEDNAVIAGFARFNGESVAVIGQEKGNDTQSRLKHNFGMARPEGYRKAVRVMDLADRFGIPLISIVDTTGAYPGIGAEERGQAEAIAQSTSKCLGLKVPNIAVVIGEGGSGGAIAIATANQVYMLEHAIYSVISPEGAASILWRDSARAKDAATNMKITAQDLMTLKVIDGIVPEPIGGAHRAPEKVIAAAGDQIEEGICRDGRRQDGLPRASPREIPRHRPDIVGTDQAAEARCGLRTTRTVPLFPPPQKKRSPPSDSRPEIPAPDGMSSCVKTAPVSGSMRRRSLSSPSHVPCHSSPSTQVTPVTKRLDSIVRRMAPVSGSSLWIFRSRYCPTQSAPSAHARPELPPLGGAGMVASTEPVSGSIFSMRSSAIWNICAPSKAVPAIAVISIERTIWPVPGSTAFNLSPEANQTFFPSWETP